MYFLELKNTAHPPIIGALGHSTDCIVKQPKTATIKIDLYSYSPVLCCHRRNSGLSCRSCMYKQSFFIGQGLFPKVLCSFPRFTLKVYLWEANTVLKEFCK